jgi:hypothetical protein
VTNRLDCEPLASSVRSARLFVVDQLQAWRCDELVDRAALLTSELATNAVVHTGRPYSVRIARRGLTVRVEVFDRVEALPIVQDHRTEEHRSEEQTFSGLGIVAASATAWGSAPIPGEGKVVWFELTSDGDDEAGDDPSALHDLRDTTPWSSSVRDLDGPIDDWLVALGGPRLPRLVRAGIMVVGVALLIAVALLVRG